MLKLYQQDDNCFGVSVACITELPLDDMPDTRPTNFPEDIEGVWSEWAEMHGLDLYINEEEPAGLCVAQVELLGADILKRLWNAERVFHSVVWENGRMVWNPEVYMMYDMGEPFNFVAVE